SDVERLGPGGVLAHDDGGLHVLLFDQQFLGGVADRQRQRGRGQITVEGVFVLLIVVVDAFEDLVGRSPWRDEGRLQARRRGFQRERYFADIAGDDDIDLVLIDSALEGANGIG